MFRSRTRAAVGLRAPAVAVLISIFSGCASMQAMLARLKHEEPDGDANAQAFYAGPECKETGMSPNSIYGHVDPEGSRRSQILDIICVPSGGFFAHPGSRFNETGYERLHVGFRDRRPDPVFAAILVSDCGRSGYCQPDVDPPSVAMMSFYAERYDEATLTAAMTSEGLPPAASQAFVKVAMLAKAQVVAQKPSFNPTFQKIFVEMPQKLATERWAMVEHNGALYSELDRVVPEMVKAVSDDRALWPLVAKVDELREKYLARCGAPSCIYDPFFVEATLAIIEVQFAADKKLDVAANVHFLFDKGAAPSTYAEALWNKQIEAISAHNKRLEEYEAAKKSGLSPALLAAKFPEGEPTARIPGHWIFEGRGGDFQRIKSYSGGDYSVGAARVKSLGKEGGGMLKVSFYDDVISWQSADCRSTGKIIRYDYQNNSLVPVYDEICGPSTTVKENKKIEPVMIPEREARAIKVGHTIHYLVDGARGEARVLESYDRDRPLTMRGLKLPAAKGTAARAQRASARG